MSVDQEQAEGQANSASNKLACREKYWEEMDTVGQVQRLREVVTTLARKLTSAEKMIGQLLQHQHASNGDLVRSIKDTERPDGYSYDAARSIRTQRERDQRGS